MSVEVIERCDICGVNCADVLRDHDPQSLRSIGYGYIKVKRFEWRFGPWPRFWHREDRGFDTICDVCLDAIREAVERRREPLPTEPDPCLVKVVERV